MTEQLVLDAVSKQLGEKRVIRNYQHGLAEGKSCSAKLVAFSDAITSWVDGGRAVNVIYLDFSKTVETIPPIILAMKPKTCEIEQ